MPLIDHTEAMAPSLQPRSDAATFCGGSSVDFLCLSEMVAGFGRLLHPLLHRCTYEQLMSCAATFTTWWLSRDDCSRTDELSCGGSLDHHGRAPAVRSRSSTVPLRWILLSS